jgi:hypothetical protein
VVAHTHPLYNLPRRLRQEDVEFEASLGKVSKVLSRKENTNKRARSVAQVVKHLLSICKALGSNSSTGKKIQSNHFPFPY